MKKGSISRQIDNKRLRAVIFRFGKLLA